MTQTQFAVVVVLATLADLVAAMVVLFGRLPGGDRRRSAIGLPHVLRAATATVIVFAVKAPILAVFGLNVFGLMHLAYLDLAVILPITGAAVLLTGKRWRGRPPWRTVTRPVRIIAIVALAAIPIGLDATYVEPFRLKTEQASVRLRAEREGTQPVTVGVLADLQFAEVTDYERSAVDRLMALKPDVILLPGDFYHGTLESFDRQREAVNDLLARLSAPGGVYAVLGNIDPPPFTAAVLARSRVTLLRDQIVTTRVRDRRLTIGGVTWPCNSMSAVEAIDRLEGASGAGDVRILLTHMPDAALFLPPRPRVDLVVAGHTHGGQVQLPLIGPLLTFSHVPRSVAGGGLHTLGGTQVYVSRGVGCERGQAPRIRFLCPPEISLLTLEGGQTREHHALTRITHRQDAENAKKH